MANQGKKTKIALVGYKLATGGLERVWSTVSGLLHESDCDVHVIVLEDEIEYPYFGTLLNLGKHSKFQKYIQLKKYLKTNQFDYIIDFRHRINPWMELVFLFHIYAGFKTIYTVHTSVLELHFTKKRWVSKQIFDKVHKVLSVSNAINEKIKGLYSYENGVVIANCVSEKTANLERFEGQLPYKYCIAVGRLVKMKQFDKLIETYCKTDLPNKNIHLVILGDGEDFESLQNQIEQSERSEFIHLLGFIEVTTSYTQNAEFLILTSEYEGFPMVILEALDLGTPVVSFDCETGPSEMITNEFNGLLVENQNFEALKIALNKLINDPDLYDFCQKNAKASIAPFSREEIRKKWLDLLNLNTN